MDYIVDCCKMGFWIIMLVIPSLYICKDDAVHCFPHLCKCNEKEAFCTGIELQYIPRFPKRIIYVYIENTSLCHINDNTLFNLTFNKVQRLYFVNNMIKTMSEYALSNLPSLYKLKVSNETILAVNELYLALRNLKNPKEIISLDFSYNGWQTIPEGMLDIFAGGKLKNLNLKGNQLDYINGTTLSQMSNLFSLRLQENQFTSVPLHGIYPKLIELSLGRNNIRKLPKWCDSKDNSRFPRLQKLSFFKNKIPNLNHFRCLSKLRNLSLEDNKIGKLYADTFRQLTSIKALNLKSVGRLKKIESNVFMSLTLESLSLRDTEFRFDQLNTNLLSTIFSGIPKLKSLDISNNYFGHMEHTVHQTLNRLLRPVLMLKTLKIENAGLFHIPKGLFTQFLHLETLSLQDNKLIRFIDGKAIFGNISTLRYLSLQNNRISIINKNSFTKELRISLKTINFAQNQYMCTCDLMWYVNWLKATQIDKDMYPNEYICMQPNDLSGKKLIEYNPTTEDCFPWNPLYTAAILVSSATVCVILIIFFLIRCQSNLKNYLYLLRIYHRRRQGYLPIDNADDFEYHAFVVYCNADRKWVHTDLLNKLEVNEGLRLCIHHRDFEPGETISGNTEKLLRKSWKVIVVMSNDFAKSEWCQWEVDIVQERRRRQGRDVFILIMLKSVNSRNMTSPMRTLLDSTPYLKYKKGVGEDLFWKAVLETLRKPVGIPPISVL